MAETHPFDGPLPISPGINPVQMSHVKAATLKRLRSTICSRRLNGALGRSGPNTVSRHGVRMVRPEAAMPRISRTGSNPARVPSSKITDSRTAEHSSQRRVICCSASTFSRLGVNLGNKCPRSYQARRQCCRSGRADEFFVAAPLMNQQKTANQSLSTDHL